jgi:hypothetical protein
MIINYTSSQEHYNNKCFAAGLIWHYLLFLSTKKKSKNSNALPTICLEVIFDPVINFHPQFLMVHQPTHFKQYLVFVILPNTKKTFCSYNKIMIKVLKDRKFTFFGA